MDNNDKKQFKELFDGLSEYYQSKEKLSKMALQIYFNSLQRFDFEQITQAVSAHVSNADSGKFYPKASDIIRHLEGGEITADILLAAANTANTPLGILAMIKIGSWHLGRGDKFILRQLSKECLLMVPEWKERGMRGDYTDHEITIMMSRGVDPRGAFFTGIASAPDNCGLEHRMREAERTDYYKRLICVDEKEDNTVNKEQLKLIKSEISKVLQ